MNIHELIVKTAEVAGLATWSSRSVRGRGTDGAAGGAGPAVVAVDVDPAMARLTAEAVAGLPNVRVLQLDALAGKHTIDPTVLDSVAQALAGGRGPAVQARGQPALSHRDPADHQLAGPSRAVPGSCWWSRSSASWPIGCALAGEPGLRAVSVVVQALAEVSIVRALPPSVFWPRPKVDSAVVAIRPEPQKRAAVGDVGWFQPGSPHVPPPAQVPPARPGGDLADQWTKADVDRWLESQGLSGSASRRGAGGRRIRGARACVARTLWRASGRCLPARRETSDGAQDLAAPSGGSTLRFDGSRAIGSALPGLGGRILGRTWRSLVGARLSWNRNSARWAISFQMAASSVLAFPG